MISVARVNAFLEAPLHGAIVALLIAGSASMLGLPEALGIARPLALPCALLAGALLGRWFLRPMFLVAVVMSFLVAIGIWSPVVPSLAAPFVRNDAVKLDDVDAVFVFSNSVNSHGLVSGEGLDRLLTGIALRAKRPTLPLIVSVVRGLDRVNAATSTSDQRALIGLVPAAGPVEWIDSVFSTRDEAVRLSRRAFSAHWKKVAVVTSPMHTRRACATVEALGLSVTCVAAPWRPAGFPARTSGDRLLVMQRLTYEALAWAEYRLTGWASWN